MAQTAAHQHDEACAEERGRWSVWVNGNWRVTFEFKDGHALVLDYEDYH